MTQPQLQTRLNADLEATLKAFLDQHPETQRETVWNAIKDTWLVASHSLGATQ